MDKKIILAGYGYMANRIANKLKQHDILSSNKVYAISRNRQTKPSGINSIILDLDNIDALGFSQTEIFDQSSIVYLVPPPSTGKTDPRLANFLSIIQNSAYLPEKFILISTTGVYGNCHGNWVDETTRLNPQVDRAMRRADAESQLQNFCKSSADKQITCTILRVSGIYAEDKLPLARIKKQLPIVNKNESAYSNRIHADDLTTICYLSLMHKYPGIFNCSDSSPSTMYDYFTSLADKFNLAQPPVITMQQASKQLSAGMLSYLQESRRISNKKLLDSFKLELKYPSLSTFLDSLKH